jgi:hypothetical protein
MVRLTENDDVHHFCLCTYSAWTIQVQKTFPTKLIGRGNSAPASVNAVSCSLKILDGVISPVRIPTLVRVVWKMAKFLEQGPEKSPRAQPMIDDRGSFVEKCACRVRKTFASTAFPQGDRIPTR